MRDHMDMQLQCTLWGDLAKEVSHYTIQNGSSPVVCVIRFACIKEWRGNLIISSAFNSTHILFNPEILEVESLLKMLPDEDVNLSGNVENQKSTPPSVTLYDAFFVLSTKRTIGDIRYSYEVGAYVTIEKVNSIQTVPKWYYIACKVSNMIVQPYPENSDDDSGPPLYSCAQCNKDVSDVLHKYKLILRVSYSSTDEIKLLVFDGLAQHLLGKSASELFNEVAEEDPFVLPISIVDLVGKTLLFKITVTPDNLKSEKAAYVVDKLWDKEDMVQKFTKEILNPEFEEDIKSPARKEVDDDSPVLTTVHTSKKTTATSYQTWSRKKIKTEPND